MKRFFFFETLFLLSSMIFVLQNKKQIVMTRKKSLRLLVLLAIGMLVWLLPKSLWAKEEMIIKETYNGAPVNVTYQFHYKAVVFMSVNGEDEVKKDTYFEERFASGTTVKFRVTGNTERFTANYSISRDATYSVELENCNELRQLEFLHFKGNSAKIELRDDAPKLSDLNINYLKDGGGVVELKISNCPYIKKLENVNNFKSLDLTNVPLTEIKGDKLESVKLRDCDKVEKIVGSSVLQNIEATNCPKLATIEGVSAVENWLLDNCSLITAIDLKPSSKLKSLVAKNCANLATVKAGSAELTKLDLSSSKVTNLDISGCSKLALIEGLSSFVSSLVNLNVNSSSIATLDVKQGSKLKSLEANNCGNLSLVKAGNADLTKLDLSGSKQVSYLDISGCSKLSEITGWDSFVGNLAELKANACALTRIDASKGSKLKSLEAKNCAKLEEVKVISEVLTKFDISSSPTKTIVVSGCTKLGTITYSEKDLVKLECNDCTSFSVDKLKNWLEGGASKLEVCEARRVNLPTSLTPGTSLKKLDLYQAKGLTSFSVKSSSNLEELELDAVSSLKELDVLQAKALKSLNFNNTNVPQINLEGLSKLEKVVLPSQITARNFADLVCQLPDRLSSSKDGELIRKGTAYSSSEKALINGKAATLKRWKLMENDQNITKQCTSEVSCNEFTIPSNPDAVHLSVSSGTTKFKVTVKKNTVLWIGEENDVKKYKKTQYLKEGEHEISESTSEIYFFAQPSAISKIKVVSNNENVKSIVLTRVPALEGLDFEKATKLTELNIRQQSELKVLKITKARNLTNIDFSNNKKLEKLEVTVCGLAGSFDFSQHAALESLDLGENKITDITLGSALTYLRLAKNQLTSLDVSKATRLANLFAYDNKLRNIKLAADVKCYKNIDVEVNELASLHLHNAVNLVTLYVNNNENLGTLDLRGCVNLGNVFMGGCKAFNSIYVTGATEWFLHDCNAIKQLYIHGSSLNANQLSKLYCKLPNVQDGKLRVVDLSNPDNLKEAKKSGTSIAKGKGWNVLDSEGKSFTGITMSCDDLEPNGVPMVKLELARGKTTVKFKTSDKKLWIKGKSGEFDLEEVETEKLITKEFDVEPLGIEIHGKLTTLDISGQSLVKELEISNHEYLTEIDASNCSQMKELTLGNMAKLEKLNVNQSNVKELMLANFPALKELNCAGNQLKELNLLSNTKLEKVDCSDNSNLKAIHALKKVGTSAAPLKELKCYSSGLGISAFNDLFCALPDREASAKGKLYAVKDLAEGSSKLVPSDSHPSRATKRNWDIVYKDGQPAALNPADNNSACEATKVTNIIVSDFTIQHNDSKTLVAKIEPPSAENQQVTWTVKEGADKVKMVNDILVAKELGTAKIECAATDGSNVKTEFTVTVIEKPVEKIEITANVLPPYKIGDKVQFTAKITPAKATYQEITWSLDGSAATIDPKTGVFVAKGVTSSLTVIAQNNSTEHKKRGEYKVSIQESAVKGLILSQKEIKIKADGNKYYVGVTLDPASASCSGTINITANPEAIVSATCTPKKDNYGLNIQPFMIELEGIQEGQSTTLTISPSDFPSIKAELKVEVVQANELVEPTGIDLPARITAVVGRTQKIEATVQPLGATNRTVLWSVKDPVSAEVLRIDTDGNITPLKGGRATVVARAAGKPSIEKECIVDVTKEVDEIPADVKKVVTLTVKSNETFQLKLAGIGDVYIKAADKALQYALSSEYTSIEVNPEKTTVEIYGVVSKLEAKDGGAKITGIQFTEEAKKITELDIQGNEIATLDLSNLTKLKVLNCTKNKLTALNLEQLTELTNLYCGQNAAFAELNLAANVNLEELSCEGLYLRTLDLSANAMLKKVVCYANSFTTQTYNDIFCSLPTVTDGVIIPAKDKVTGSQDLTYQALLQASSGIATKKGWKVVYEDMSTIATTGTQTECEHKPATGITIEPLSVEVGKTKQIKYRLMPNGATATVKFKSLDETIATVDDNGNVTGVKEGKVKIEVTTDVATVKGECDVTVEANGTTPDPGVAVEDAVFANVLVAPNPFEADLRIVLDGESQGVKYELINANGSIVRKGTIVANDTRIETAELTAGIYILRLTSESGKTKSFTLVKK